MRLRISALSVLIVTASSGTAFAGGFEFSVPGTHALMRGGAFYVRADDPMALYFNPAQLADLDGIQLTLQSHIPLFTACFDRAQSYDEASLYRGPDGANIFGGAGTEPPDGYAGVEFPEVCNSRRVSFIPELMMSWRVSDKVGLGIGLIAPSGIGAVRWGSAGAGLIDVDQDGYEGQLPAPTRYEIVDANLLIAHAAVGIGFAPIRRFRIGATFGWGFGIMDFTNYTREIAGEAIRDDILTRTRARDMFIPGVILSAHAEPIDGLELMVGFRWNDSVNASGDLELTSGAFAERDASNPGPEPFERRTRECAGADLDPNERFMNSRETPTSTSCVGAIDNVRIRANLPWQLRFGVRYASRLSEDELETEEGEEAATDPLSTEKWDIEFNFTYERNSVVDTFHTTVPEDTTLITETAPLVLPTDVDAVFNWKDQYTMALGGDYNWIPGRFATSLGLSFETNGVDDPYASNIFMPFQRVGVHLGATLRVGPIDLYVAYAHIFFQSRDVTVDEADIPQIVAVPPPDGPEETRINAGSYSAHIDVISVGATARF